MKFSKILLAALFCVGCQVAGFAQTSVSLVKTMPAGQTLFSDTVGYKFTVGSKPLKVSALGVARGNGLNSANQVGLWDEAGQLIASATIPLNATLENGFLWQALSTEITLAASSSYMIAACGTNNSFEYRYNGFVELSADVQLVGFVRNNQYPNVVFSKPSLTGVNGQGAVGANIQYSVEDAPSPSAEMVTVQGGTLPSSSQLAGQTVETFQIGKYEVTWGEWKAVRDWAVANGYTDLAGVGGTFSDGSGDRLPASYVSWFDAVKWCNARSQKEGLTPVYQNGGVAYKTGQSVPSINIAANGYRLPLEKEWEWAARGGVKSQGYIYSGSNNVSDVMWHNLNAENKAHEVGTKLPNELGIHDMSGNLWEWCWDPVETYYRRIRGGSWADCLSLGGGASGAVSLRVTFFFNYHPENRPYMYGFRLARNAVGEMLTVQGGTLPSSSGLAEQTVGTFQISKFETTWGEWKTVRDWAVNNGYTDLANVGAGSSTTLGAGSYTGLLTITGSSAEDNPVGQINWYDAVKWCNAKSQMEGLIPVYMLGGAIYKTGQSEPTINSSANGYRLPTEEEWEWAARGGAMSQGYLYSGGNDLSAVAWTNGNSGGGRKKGGTKAANELGIYDMSGNMWEWCWGACRFRGGGFADSNTDYFTVRRRNWGWPGSDISSLGLRYARNAASPADTTAPVIAITSISANARLTSANATFGGTITETGSKPSLEFRLGTTGNWTASTVGGSASPYSFSQLVALKPGPNTVQFQAKDDAGNTSALASVNVSYVVASTLTITAPNAADGSVTSGFGGSTSREVGVSYTVTATPASGMVFKEWLKNGVSTSTNATLTFTMQAGLTLTPLFVPDFAKLGGFYNGLVGVGAIGNGTAADMQAFAANNGFIQITSGANGALSGVLKIEGKSHSFTGTMGANKRATITVPRPGKSNATLSLSLVSALPGEISGNVTTTGAPLAFRALRGGYTAGAAKHTLAGKRYAIVLPPPSGLAMGYGHATLTVEDDGAVVLSGMLANGQAVNTGARIVDDGAGNWVFPVYVGGSGIFTGEIVIPKTTPASGSELGGSLEWLKPASNTGLFKSGFLKSLQPLGATHSTTSAGLGGAAFSLTLDPAKRILPAAVVQTGTWGNSGSPSLTTPVKSGLTLRFNPLSGKFEGSFTRTVNSAPIPTPIQGTLFSRPITIPGGATLRGAGFFTSGNASTAVEITSNGTVEASANMVTVQGGTLPSSSQLAGQTVGTFQIGKYEVTWGEWKDVRDWAVNNGYTDLANVGEGSGEDHPVRNLSWFDVVKWCNAKSNKEGLTPVYKLSGATYRTGESVPAVDLSGNGYRLPLEKEWEWAAMGGVASKGYTYSGGNDINTVGWYDQNSLGALKPVVNGRGTWPVGQKGANEMAIHDMSGNVWEWCWDLYDLSDTGDPYSPRRYRGGSWYYHAQTCAVGFRDANGNPSLRYFYGVGFRLARNAGN